MSAPATGAFGPRSPTARDRILEAAYDLFSRRGVRAVGINEVIGRAGVAKATLYDNFASKDDLVLSFLAERERRWTRDWVEAEASRRGGTPRERLLAIFDVFDEWFRTPDFEGCAFINILLETRNLQHPVGRDTAVRLENIRSLIRRLAEKAELRDPEGFAHSWHILMKGSIVAAGEGDREAAMRAQAMGRALIAAHEPMHGTAA